MIKLKDLSVDVGVAVRLICGAQASKTVRHGDLESEDPMFPPFVGVACSRLETASCPSMVSPQKMEH